MFGAASPLTRLLRRAGPAGSCFLFLLRAVVIPRPSHAMAAPVQRARQHKQRAADYLVEGTPMGCLAPFRLRVLKKKGGNTTHPNSVLEHIHDMDGFAVFTDGWGLSTQAFLFPASCSRGGGGEVRVQSRPLLDAMQRAVWFGIRRGGAL